MRSYDAFFASATETLSQLKAPDFYVARQNVNHRSYVNEQDRMTGVYLVTVFGCYVKSDDGLTDFSFQHKSTGFYFAMDHNPWSYIYKISLLDHV